MSIELLLPVWMLLAVVAAAGLGVFKPKRVLGRSRLSEGESPAIILRIVGFALGTWAVCYLCLGEIHQELARRQAKPANTVLSSDEIVVFSGAAELTVFTIILVATIGTRRDGVRQMGINRGRIPVGVILGIIGIAMAWPMIVYINDITELALRHWNVTSPPHELLAILKDNPSPWLRAAVVISAGVIAPLAEESFFRGLIQTVARNFFGNSWLAIVIGAGAFALVHMWYTWPPIFFLGICLGYAYERSGNLWVSITMHAIFNVTSMWFFTH